MHLSCKLTQTILLALDQLGVECGGAFEEFPVPEELLRDPSYWIRIEDFEIFLTHLDQMLSQSPQTHSVRWDDSALAQTCVQTRAWGVLDSVLRMMSSPSDVFAQPERFLSYFLAPPPVVTNLQRTQQGLGFDVVLPVDLFPRSFSFLSASLEVIPLFQGMGLASCRWLPRETGAVRLEIDWSQPQTAPLSDEPSLGRETVSPRLAQNLLQEMAPIMAANHSVERTSSAGPSWLVPTGTATTREVLVTSHVPVDVIEDLRHQVSRLSDYMIRAQQIITLMQASQKLSPEVREAMRRVDWAFVQKEFPQTVEKCYQVFRKQTKLESNRKGDCHV